MPGATVEATVMVNVDEPESTIVAGDNVAVKPAGAVAVSVMVPVNPLIAVVLIDDTPLPPAGIVNDDGLALIVKS